MLPFESGIEADYGLQEKAGLFHKYVIVNTLAVIASFGIAAAFIAISGTKHDTATNRCEVTFFSGSSTASTSSTTSTSTSGSGEGKQVCEVFTWVILGLMGGLWVALAIFQVSLLRPHSLGMSF